jgi:hypothetical protein
MKGKMNKTKIAALAVLVSMTLTIPILVIASGMRGQPDMIFPMPLASYQDSHLTRVIDILIFRIKHQPMNLVVSALFLCAIIHTFCVGFFRRTAEKWEKEHIKNNNNNGKPEVNYNGNVVDNVSFGAEIFYLLGEVEIIFGMWVIPVFWAIVYGFGWHASLEYMSSVNFTEPMFVVVIMTLASSRPISRFSEDCMRFAAKIGKGSTATWWFIVLTIGPVLGSFITEPGAMTISAMLLAKQFYQRKPSRSFAYATIGLLFVNISVGGTLSHFAAPPVLMVAGVWKWDTLFMLSHFGWKALFGIMTSNLLYFFIFRPEFKRMDLIEVDHNTGVDAIDWDLREDPIPYIVTLIHISMVVWTILTSHYPVLFVSGFFVYIGFRRATAHHQNETNLKPSMLVGFFLAGLVIHGGLQAWWIAPILGSLGELHLMLGATFLTAFNDNAAIAYLATLVPSLSESMKYAVVVGAVTGGGLTVIANAPNPAGLSILREYFKYGISPARLFLGALIPTIIMGLSFMLLP